MIWILLALMTAAAIFAVLWPLSRKFGTTHILQGHDVAVYRDQIEEIERDRASGLIGASEAEAARIEVSRRLIAAADAMVSGAPGPERKARRDSQGTSPTQPQRRRLAAAVTIVALPLGAASLYLALGSPNLTGQPLGEQVAAGSEAVEAAFARVEAHLEQHPEDGRGWEVIAPVYMRVGRYEDAVKARTNALRLLGATAERAADLGEALVAAANGVVTAEAKGAFDEAIRLDPTDVSARFYQGLAAEQDGNPTEAARLWRALLANAPPNAPWSPSVRRALARVGAGTAGQTAAKESAQQAGDGPAGQEHMIRSMVERLAARLQQDGSDLEGWLRLVRSYRVLGDAERERVAQTDARAALANDPEKLQRLEEGFKALAADLAVAPAPPTVQDIGAGGASAKGGAQQASDAPAGQEQMIRSMVERLAARLQQDGSDVEGWLRLVRSYGVLGDAEKERAAQADARAALANDPEKLRSLEEGLKELTAGAGTAASSAVGARTPSVPDSPGSNIPPQHDPMAMVERLAARLQRDGSDLNGWLQLVRSYGVLGDAEKERAARANARAALANDPGKLRRLEEGFKDLAAGAASANSSTSASTPPLNDAASKAAPPEHEPVTMVERLAARLQRDGSDLDGWLMLVRSYKALGDADRARAAVANARRALADAPDKLRGFEEGVRKLGVDGFER
jgi:cytochrome c-type biogenesis protein CcmH